MNKLYLFIESCLELSRWFIILLKTYKKADSIHVESKKPLAIVANGPSLKKSI